MPLSCPTMAAVCLITHRVLRGVVRHRKAVKGDICILVDGGVRDGSDVLKMVALGADAVMIGRPVSVAAMGGLQEGVEKYYATLKGQLKQAMVLTGSADIKSITDRVLFK